MMRLCIGTYQLTKAIDPSRPVNGIAGDVHFMSDIWSIRNYESDAIRFAQHLKPNNRMAFYNNQPFFIGEFGGILWTESTKRDSSWGYGKMEFIIMTDVPSWICNVSKLSSKRFQVGRKK